MAKGPLRLAIEDFVFTNANPPGGPGYFERVRTRWLAYWTTVSEIGITNPLGVFIYAMIHVPSALIYALFGVEALHTSVQNFKAGVVHKDLGENLNLLFQSVIESPELQSLAGLMGEEITKPVLDLFKQYAGRDDVDPAEFVSKLQGLINVLNLTGALVDVSTEALTLGQMDGVGRLISTLYNSLGLGLLSEAAWRPFLTHGLHPAFDRFYNEQFRPARFGANDLRDLYALGEIDPGTLRNEAKLQGWRDSDIEKWIKLAFRTLPQGDIFDAFHQGFLSEDAATARLRALGYDPADIPLLYKLNPKKETQDAKAFSVSNARSAFSEGLIAEGELRKILKDLKYSDREIDIIVALEKLSKETKDRLLSASDIKAAWTDNVLTDQEARHWLEVAGFAPEQLDILIATWKQQIIPDYRKLNAGTIEGAYVEGILTKSQAHDKLTGVGFTSDDADLELSLVEARNPEAFGRPLPVTPKKLSPGILSGLVQVGLISPAQMRDRLVALHYSEEDANLLSEAARISALPATRLLSQGSIENAYFAGIFTRAQATTALKALGFNDAAARTVIDIVQNQLDQIKVNKERQQQARLSPGTLTDLVIAGIITSDEMHTRLVDNGFSVLDADLLTQRATQLAVAPVRILTQSTIESAYLVGVLTRDQAKDKLVGLDFTPEDAETILVTLERENPNVFSPNVIVSTRQPSIGALVTALQMTIIDETQYLAKTAELGYSPEDAALYTSIAVKAEKKSTKILSVSQLAQAYNAGFLPFPTALSRITSQGYSDADGTLLLRLQKDLIQNTDVWDQLLAGNLDPFDAIAQLVNAHYADKDILDAFAGLGPVTLDQMAISLTDLEKALAATPGGT